MSAWQDHVTAALLGASKGAPPPLPATVEPVLGEAAAIAEEARFLTQAGALALWHRAGWQPARHEAEILAADPETTAPLDKISAGHLHTMLSGRWAAVLSEWLGEVVRRQRHVPPETLPALLDRAQRERSLRDLVLAAGGRRAHWLIAQNADWSFAPAEVPDAWETGSREQRVALLRALRTTVPAEARAKIEAVWKTEPADTRTAFTAELATGLSPEDIPFLEAALDDRSKETRRAAIDLLARLPSSPFVARMIARATPLFTFKKGGLLSRTSLDVTLPGDPDAAATRDGLESKAFGAQKILGEKAVHLVLILSAVPLRHWTDTFQQSPAILLKASAKSEFARALTTGWTWAALRQRDAAWAAALLDSEIEAHREFLPAEPLLAILPEAERASRLAAQIRVGAMKKAGSAEWLHSLAELTVLADRAPASLIREALTALRTSVANGLPHYFRVPAEGWLLRLPPAMLAEAASGWPLDQEGIAALVEVITFRQDALSALNQP